jgi:hypoxanthine-DNA glycosylase
MHAESFPPVATPDSPVLILGTMSGKVSLREGQSYAHPRNALWQIAAEILGFDAASPYDARVYSLKAHGIALWDDKFSVAEPRPAAFESGFDLMPGKILL